MQDTHEARSNYSAANSKPLQEWDTVSVWGTDCQPGYSQKVVWEPSFVGIFCETFVHECHMSTIVNGRVEDISRE